MYYIDRVCKKKLRRKEEYAISKYGGIIYRVCCKSRKEEFQKHPIDFIQQGNKETAASNE